MCHHQVNLRCECNTVFLFWTHHVHLFAKSPVTENLRLWSSFEMVSIEIFGNLHKRDMFWINSCRILQIISKIQFDNIHKHSERTTFFNFGNSYTTVYKSWTDVIYEYSGPYLIMWLTFLHNTKWQLTKLYGNAKGWF